MLALNMIQKKKKVLKSINLKLEGEKMTALVGHSGAGKSTILKFNTKIL